MKRLNKPSKERISKIANRYGQRHKTTIQRIKFEDTIVALPDFVLDPKLTA